MVDIPKNAAEITENSSASQRENMEFELLQAEAALRALKTRAEQQRYSLRWIAVITGVLVICGMAFAFAHLVHQTFVGPFHFASPAFSVAMIVAPIASITAITVALFVSAFRKFDDKDLETMGNGASGALGLFRPGS